MSFRAQFVSSVLFYASKLLFKTLRVKYVGVEQIEAMRTRYGGVILATWHGRTMVPIVSFDGQGCWALVSTSRDGTIQAKLLELYGFKTVRGSSSARGAVMAALRLARTINKGRVLTITPDGPRGPIHVPQPGAIFLAEKSGCPIIPAGISAYPRKFLNTWDKYMVPYLGARAAIVYGEPLLIPPDLDDNQRAEYGRVLAERIESVEEEAEQIVRCGGVKRSAPVY